MLGKLSKNFREEAGISSWISKGTQHFVIQENKITDSGLKHIQQIGKANFHYLSRQNVETLKQISPKLKANKGKSVIIEFTNNLSGKKNKTLRNYLNRYTDLDIRDFTESSDVKKMLKRWSDTLGEKYFRNMSGKNLHFIQNGYHEHCENVFIYDEEDLVSFGIASPVQDGCCSYIIGKALSSQYPGLAEFTDWKLYKKLFEKYGMFRINLGQAEKGLLFYKLKFQGAYVQEHFHGTL